MNRLEVVRVLNRAHMKRRIENMTIKIGSAFSCVGNTLNEAAKAMSLFSSAANKPREQIKPVVVGYHVVECEGLIGFDIKNVMKPEIKCKRYCELLISHSKFVKFRPVYQK